MRRGREAAASLPRRQVEGDNLYFAVEASVVACAGHSQKR